MTPDEVANVLAKCAAYDQRTVGRMDIAAWAEALADVELVDALPAVTGHYRSTTRRAMPADIRERAAEHRDMRRRAENRTPLASLPPGVHETDAERDARIAAGVARARSVLKPRLIGATHPTVAEAMERRRAAEAAHRAEQEAS
jgi:hypothetical protein